MLNAPDDGRKGDRRWGENRGMRDQAAIAAGRLIDMRVMRSWVAMMTIHCGVDRAIGCEKGIEPMQSRQFLRDRRRERCHQDCKQSEPTANLPKTKAQHAAREVDLEESGLWHAAELRDIRTCASPTWRWCLHRLCLHAHRICSVQLNHLPAPPNPARVLHRARASMPQYGTLHDLPGRRPRR